MNDGRQALMPESGGESRPLANFPAPANTTGLALRVWTPAQQDLQWTSDSPLIHLISDLISANDGALGQEAGVCLIARFGDPAHALRTAKRIQWALLEFSQHRPRLCLGAAALIYDAHDIAAESETSSVRALTATLEQAKPAQILALEGASEQLQSLPGLQFRLFTASHRSSQSRARVQEIIWTTPSNLERAQDVLRRAAQSLAQNEAHVAASEPTADLSASARKRNAEPTLVHCDQAPRPFEADRDLTPDFVASEPELERRGSSALWWSLAGIGVLVAVLTAAFLLPRSRPKAALPASPPPVAQPGVGTETETPQPEPPTSQKISPEAEAPTSAKESSELAPPAPPKSVDDQGGARHHGALSPRHREGIKKATEYDGLTEKDIPRLVRMAESNAGAGRYEEARREFNAVLRLDPSNAEAKQGLRKLDLSEREAP